MPESEEKRETLQNTMKDTQKKSPAESLQRFWKEKLTPRKRILLAAVPVLILGCLIAAGSGIKTETARAVRKTVEDSASEEGVISSGEEKAPFISL